MPDIGSRLVEGLWSGMQSRSGWLQGQITNFNNNIKQQFTREFEIRSPSRWAYRVLGVHFADGFGNGIIDRMERVSKEVVACVKDMLSEIPNEIEAPLLTPLEKAGWALRDMFDIPAAFFGRGSSSAGFDRLFGGVHAPVPLSNMLPATVTGGATYIENNFLGDWQVRSDEDIESVATALFKKQQASQRRKGLEK